MALSREDRLKKRREYYQAHIDKRRHQSREQARRRSLSKRAEVLATRRAWRLRNRDQVRKSWRDYKRKNRVRINALQRARYSTNREALLAANRIRFKAQRRAHPELVRAKARASYAKRRIHIREREKRKYAKKTQPQREARRLWKLEHREELAAQKRLRMKVYLAARWRSATEQQKQANRDRAAAWRLAHPKPKLPRRSRVKTDPAVLIARRRAKANEIYHANIERERAIRRHYSARRRVIHRELYLYLTREWKLRNRAKLLVQARSHYAARQRRQFKAALSGLSQLQTNQLLELYDLSVAGRNKLREIIAAEND